MNAIPNDDHILRMACNDFQSRHTVVLRLMALKHDTEAEMLRIIDALQNRRDAIDAIQRLGAVTLEGHRAKARVAVDVMGHPSEDDVDGEFIRSVLLNFIAWEHVP